METISGGTIDMLRASWNQLYYSETKPMNVILVGGLNDIPNYDFARLTHHIILFKRNVKQHNPANLFFVAGMLRPPKYAWFEGNGPEPSLPFGKFYTNHLEKIDQVNEFINSLNVPLRLPPLSFATMGTRKIMKRDSRGQRYRVIQHQFSAWREYPNMHMMLHLNDQKRAVMFNRTIRYIEEHILPKYK
jgi:hypothetical protein